MYIIYTLLVRPNQILASPRFEGSTGWVFRYDLPRHLSGREVELKHGRISMYACLGASQPMAQKRKRFSARQRAPKMCDVCLVSKTRLMLCFCMCKYIYIYIICMQYVLFINYFICIYIQQYVRCTVFKVYMMCFCIHIQYTI